MGSHEVGPTVHFESHGHVDYEGRRQTRLCCQKNAFELRISLMPSIVPFALTMDRM